VALEVVLTAFLLEAVGAAILYWPMSEKAPAGAVGSACFHSISAFCNAGFSLYPDSLTQFRPVWSLNLTVAALIILGGVGFPVVRHLRRIVVERVRGHRLRVKLHTKIALITTAILLAAGMLAFFLFEGAGQMSGSPLGERLLTAFFQSVTTRTAGFNTIDFARAHDGSLFVSCILMFIGGSPASAAGGVKTTTVAVLLIVGVSMIRQRDKPDVMGRAVPREAIRRAMVLVMVEAILIACAVTALLATEGSLPLPPGKGPLTCVMFEVMSAFGTVGLSTGITPGLSLAGKAVIMLAMFLGRVGPLTLVRSIAPGARRAEYEYPEESVMVG